MITSAKIGLNREPRPIVLEEEGLGNGIKLITYIHKAIPCYEDRGVVSHYTEQILDVYGTRYVVVQTFLKDLERPLVPIITINEKMCIVVSPSRDSKLILNCGDTFYFELTKEEPK